MQLATFIADYQIKTQTYTQKRGASSVPGSTM